MGKFDWKFYDIPEALLQELKERKFLGTEYIPEYGHVPACGKCKHPTNSFDTSLLIHLWQCHEIKPKKLQEQVMAVLLYHQMIDKKGKITDKELTRFIG